MFMLLAVAFLVAAPFAASASGAWAHAAAQRTELALAGVLAQWSLNRRRLAGWDADWQATGPRWTTRT
jgi:hypothetical protein